jgi:hypothetical protein
MARIARMSDPGGCGFPVVRIHAEPDWLKTESVDVGWKCLAGFAGFAGG